MKKIIITMLIIAFTIAALASCNNEKQSATTSPTDSENTTQTETTAPATLPNTPNDTDETVTPVTDDSNVTDTPATDSTELSKSISVYYTCKANCNSSKEASSDSGSVTLASSNILAAGDSISVQLAEGQHYIMFRLSKQFEEALIYVPGDTYTITIPSDFKSFWPSNIILSLTARYPDADELSSERNLALNPYDVKTKTSAVYPHAYSANKYNDAEFGAHCAIDGFTSNKGHGTYPYQSWGPQSTVLPTDTFTIDFGREVTVNKLITYIRADFSSTGTSHDAYFSEYTVKFSDGSEVKVNPIKTANAQEFDLGSKTTSSITITGFVTDKANSSGWAGFTEVMVMGQEK